MVYYPTATEPIKVQIHTTSSDGPPKVADTPGLLLWSGRSTSDGTALKNHLTENMRFLLHPRATRAHELIRGDLAIVPPAAPGSPAAAISDAEVQGQVPKIANGHGWITCHNTAQLHTAVNALAIALYGQDLDP